MKDIEQTAVRAKGVRTAGSTIDELPISEQSLVIDDLPMHPGLANRPTATWLFTCAILGSMIADETKRSL